ncbi:MAG: FHS family L-fucose permease-like MFS transporter [Psychroserpens sp.]
MPFFFGSLIDGLGFKTAFLLVIACYAYILFYGRYKTKRVA